MAEKPTPEALEDFIRRVPQIVPESRCRECRICCRFPQVQQAKTPVWSSLEAEWAEAASGRRGWFARDPEVPSLHSRLAPCGSGYRCPAFDEGENRCSVHAVKPLDCRLYPFVLASPPAGRPVLAVDTQCPYVQAHGTDPELLGYAAALTRYLAQPAAREYLKINPRIIGRYWPEYVPVAALTEDWLKEDSPDAAPLKQAPHPDLLALGPKDFGWLREALGRQEHRSSAYVLASMFGWIDLIRFWWSSLEGMPCLFAEQAGGFYMPLPPLGERGHLLQAVRAAWGLLVQLNGNGGSSRIEGWEEQDLRLFEPLGEDRFSVRDGGTDYIYRREELAALRGDPYRSQRWAVNRFMKRWPHRIRPFEDADLGPCLRLFTRWAIRRQQEIPEPEAGRLIRDSFFFHRRLMMDHRSLGLAGRVVEVGGEIRAYTFGAPISSHSFCVLVEIADRSTPGLAQILFREFCRQMQGYAWINAMGDEGLAGLRRAKRGYRPDSMVATKVVELAGVEPAAS